jgi:hypothetical protein
MFPYESAMDVAVELAHVGFDCDIRVSHSTTSCYLIAKRDGVKCKVRFADHYKPNRPAAGVDIQALIESCYYKYRGSRRARKGMFVRLWDVSGIVERVVSPSEERSNVKR